MIGTMEKVRCNCDASCGENRYHNFGSVGCRYAGVPEEDWPVWAKPLKEGIENKKVEVMDEDKKESLFKALDELSEIYRTIADEYEIDCDNYWNGLSQDDQLKAFYSVVKRIVQGELKDKRSYRGVLYSVFGWGPESYSIGMECGYLDLHNSIYTEPLKSTLKKPEEEL